MGPLLYIIIAFPCTIGAITLVILHIYKHLLNYTEPTYQRCIVRIIFMVHQSEFEFDQIYYFSHVYALMPLLSLVFNEHAIYFGSIREVYEAWVIYNFLSLCLAWVGGPGAVVISLTGRQLKSNWCIMTCCFPSITLDGRFIRRCKQGCLQFVILKPILVAVTFLLYAKGKYKDGNFSANQSYLYITIIYTISYTMALYALAFFYMACKDLLQPFNPVPKFILIKSVIFMTYWQGVMVFLDAKYGSINDTEQAADFQHFIICVEMLIAAVAHLFAFPYKEYAGANIGVNRGFKESLAHAFKLNDFYHDTFHQFAPTYHDYVLYKNTEGEEGSRKYRARTFVPTGAETDSARKSRQSNGTKYDIQLSSLTTDPNIKEVPVKTSLLVDYLLAYSYDTAFNDISMSSYSPEVAAVDETETSR